MERYIYVFRWVSMIIGIGIELTILYFQVSNSDYERSFLDTLIFNKIIFGITMVPILLSCSVLCFKHDHTNKEIDPNAGDPCPRKTIKETLLKLADLSWSMYFFTVQKFYADYEAWVELKQIDKGIIYYLSFISLLFSVL